MKKSLLILTLFSCGNLFSQFGASSGLLHKEFSKENTEYLAKLYMAKNVMSITDEPKTLKLDAVTAAQSGELTCLVYDCEGAGKGLLFAFWGKRWNQSGVTYNAYDFIHIPQEKASFMLNKLDSLNNAFMDAHSSAMPQNAKESLVFKIDDFEFILSIFTMRVIWNDFDSHWRSSEMRKTKKKFEKLIVK
ncbi:hypothetical protein N8Z75_00170 [Crocinitomicaceae bacterium]|nr:hypothetical protein [Crocinitomicaceae bacterium]